MTTTHEPGRPEAASDLAAVTARAREALARVGAEGRFIPHASSGRSSTDAADATGRPLDEVVKTLVLEGPGGAGPVAAILLGKDRLDVRALEAITGAKDLRLAAPHRVREITGFDVGGLPPVCLDALPRVVVDEAVLSKRSVVGSGGSDRVGLEMPTETFVRLGYARGRVAKADRAAQDGA